MLVFLYAVKLCYHFLHAAFHKPETRAYRITFRVVWTLIIFSILFVLAEAILDRHFLQTNRLLVVLDDTILWLFVVELVLRVVSYHPAQLEIFQRSLSWRLRVHLLQRLRYILSPFILIDVLAVLALFPPLRSLRVLRLLRALRSVKLFPYSNPILGLLRSFQENALLYTATFSFLLVTLTLGGVSFYLAEFPGNKNIKSIGDGIWWALVTLTTVGYGDISPVTSLGRVIGGSLMIIGMFSLALFAGIVGSTLLNSMLRLREDQFRMSSYLNHIVIFGYDKGTRMLLDAMLRQKHKQQEILVFAEGHRPFELPPEFIWVSGDPFKEYELEKVSLITARTAIILGSRQAPPAQADANTILVTFTLRSYMEKNPDTKDRQKPLYVIAEILDPDNIEHAHIAGADEVIASTHLGFSFLARSAFAPGVGKMLSTLASVGVQSLFIGEFPFPQPCTYQDVCVHFQETHRTVVVGIQHRENGKIQFSPDEAFFVDSSHCIVYMAAEPIPQPHSF